MTNDERKAFTNILEGAKKLDYHILTSEDQHGNLAGMIVGSPHYVSWVLQHIPSEYKTTDVIVEDPRSLNS